MSAAEGGEVVAELASGDPFELLELTSAHGWGVAPGAGGGTGLVGYCDRAALEVR